MAAADKADLGLHPVHLAEFHGMVWVNLAPAPPPLDEYLWAQLDYRLAGDRAKFARYDLAIDGATSYGIETWKLDRPALTDPGFPTDFRMANAAQAQHHNPWETS